MMRIGVLSDTQGHLDPKINPLFQGGAQIFHAGDIGSLQIISQLEEIAPVIATGRIFDKGMEASFLTLELHLSATLQLLGKGEGGIFSDKWNN